MMRDMFSSSAISLLLCCRVAISIKHALQMDKLHRWNVVISSLMVTPCLWGQLRRLVEARDIMPIRPDQRLSESGQHKDLSGKVTKIWVNPTLSNGETSESLKRWFLCCMLAEFTARWKEVSGDGCKQSKRGYKMIVMPVRPFTVEYKV